MTRSCLCAFSCAATFPEGSGPGGNTLDKHLEKINELHLRPGKNAQVGGLGNARSSSMRKIDSNGKDTGAEEQPAGITKRKFNAYRQFGKTDFAESERFIATKLCVACNCFQLNNKLTHRCENLFRCYGASQGNGSE
jgi:hypothetical protein